VKLLATAESLPTFAFEISANVPKVTELMRGIDRALEVRLN
jgi:hypothetical protein